MKKLLLGVALAVGSLFAFGAAPAQAEPWHHHGPHGWYGSYYRPYGGYYGYRPYRSGYYRPWVGYYGPRYYGYGYPSYYGSYAYPSYYRYYSYPSYYYNPYPVVSPYYYGLPGVGLYLGF